MEQGHYITAKDLRDSEFMNEILQCQVNHKFLVELEEWQANEDQESWYRVVVSMFPAWDFFISDPTGHKGMHEYADEGFTTYAKAEKRWFELLREVKSDALAN